MTVPTSRTIRLRTASAPVSRRRRPSPSKRWIVPLGVVLGLASVGKPNAAAAQTYRAPSVVSSTQSAVVNTRFTMTQRVLSNSDFATTIRVSLGCPPQLTSCSVTPTSQSINPHDGANYTVAFTPSATGSFVITVSATDDTHALSGSGTITVNVTTGVPQVTVGPKGGTTSTPENMTGRTQIFTLSTPTGSPTTTYTIAAPTCAYPVVSCSAPSSATVTGGTPTNVAVGYATQFGPATGSITLSAANGASSDQATVNVTVTSSRPAYAVTVSPTTGSTSVTQPANTANLNTTFTVANTGTSAGTYTISQSCTNLDDCSVTPTTTDLLSANGGQMTARITYSTRGPGVTGSMTLTVSGNGIAPVFSTVTINTPPPPPNITLNSSIPTSLAQGASTSLPFMVKNAGVNTATYSIGKTCSFAAVTCGTPSPSSLTLNGGATGTVTLPVTVNATGTGSGNVGLTATVGTSTGSNSYFLSIVPVPSVTPTSGTVSVNPGTTGSTTFTIRNSSANLSGAFNYSVACPASVATCGVTTPVGGALAGSAGTLGPSATFPVTVTYVAKTTSGSSGSLSLTASSSSTSTVSGTGQQTVTVAAAPPITVLSHAQGLNGSVARDACLDLPLGKGASYECGDLRAAYALPAMTTMNRTRQPTLLFLSSHANATAIIEADVIMGAGMTPTQIVPTLKVNGVTQTGVSSFAWDPTWPTGVPRRITLPVDGATLPLGTGAYAGTYSYSLEIAATVNGVTTRQTDTGLITIVNRIDSPFGRGWWLEGYEQIVTPLDANTRLWVGGDGSTRLYVPAAPGSNTWIVPAALDRPDTMIFTGTVYQRHLPNGAFTEFDASGKHLRTVSAQGQVTQFTYDTAGLLDTLKLPLPNAVTDGPKYQFHYLAFSGLPSRLDTIHLKGPGVVDRFTTLNAKSDGWFTNIRFLASSDTVNSTKWQYDYSFGTTRELIRITDPLGQRTNILYELGMFRQSTIVFGSGATDITYTICPAETKSRSPLCSSTRPEALATAYTSVDGPRDTVADYTFFYTNRFGAPDTVVNALGVRTRFVRNLSFPLLASSIIQPNSLTTLLAYNARGLLDSTTVVAPLDPAQGNATTRYSWHSVWRLPLTVTLPTLGTSTFTYDAAKALRLTEDDGRGTTQYHYDSQSRVDIVTPPSNGNATRGTTTLGYDATLGNLATIANQTATQRLFRDEIGRVKEQQEPINGTMWVDHRTTFYASGLPYQEVAQAPGINNARPESLTVTHVYDKLGQETSLKREISNDVRGAGAPGLVTSWTYDKAGRKTSETAPDGKIDSTQYDRASNVVAIWPKTRAEFAGAITMKYDVLGRLTTRTVPAVTYAARVGEIKRDLDGTGPSGPTYVGLLTIPNSPVAQSYFTQTFPQYPNAASGGYTIPQDVASFTYDDSTNALASATNGDARVYRAYYPNGLLQQEIQQIATKDRTNFTIHSDTLRYAYDLSAHRTELYHPSQLRAGASRDRTSWTYDGAGRLTGVTDVEGNHISYVYFDDGSLQSIRHGDASDTWEAMTYDVDGRLATSKMYDYGTSPYKWVVNGSATLRSETFTFDMRNKLTQVGSDAGYAKSWALKYSGLGYLVQSDFTTETPWYNAGQNMQFASTISETYQTDGLGNIDTTGTTNSGSSTGPNFFSDAFMSSGGTSFQGSATGGSYDAALRHVRTLYVSGQVDRMAYDGAGNRDWVYQSSVAPGQGRRRDERASYYGADGKVRADDHRTLDYATKRYTSAFEEYRYDALGRRSWVETHQYCQGGYTMNPICRFSRVRRVVWDGSQELYEIQMPDSILPVAGGGSFDARENDTASVPRMEPHREDYDTYPTNRLRIDPNRLYGRVAYTYGLAVDQPVSVVRFGYVTSMDLHLNTTWAPTIYPTEIRDTAFAILPVWDYQGKAEIGTLPDGGATKCVAAPSNCTDLFWPRMFGAYGQETGYGVRTSWHGSLLEDKRDGSGLLYRRNRMYDPAAGKFTQEDPIGLAGGMNLYGFAGGDPVNYSDPFGLCPVTATDPVPCSATYGAAFGAIGAGVGVLVSGGCAAGSGGICLAGAPGIIAGGAALGTLAGGAIGHALDVLFREGDPEGASGGERAGKPFTPGGKEEVRGPEGTPCAYCKGPTTRKPGSTQSQGEHVIPKADGGNGSPDNGVNACRTCNLDKGRRSPSQWEPRWYDPK